MLKIDFSYLKYLNNKYYYQDKLFTGISFKLTECIVEEFLEFKDGICIGNYQSNYLPNDPNLLRIDVECDELEFNGDFLGSYASYKEQGFSGIAYEFEREFCVGEYFFKDGWEQANSIWDFSGKLLHINLESEEFSQGYSFNNDDSLSGINLVSKGIGGTRMLDVFFNKEGESESIYISERYFSWIIKFRDRLEYKKFTNKKDFIDLLVDSILKLSGSGVDEEIFSYLMLNNKLDNLSEMKLITTSLKENTILNLANLKNLKKIIIYDHEGELRDIAKELKYKRPDCLVELNSKEITN